MKHIALIAAALMLSLKSPAQYKAQVPADMVLEKIIEAYAPENEEEIELLYDELNRLMENPVNLNTATKQDLEEIFFLNQVQIDNLLQYRSEMEQIFSIYELQAIDGFDWQTIENLEYFVSFTPVETISREYFNRKIDAGTAYTFEKAEGFTENGEGIKKFEGIAPKLFLKYRGEKGSRFSWGLVAENDPGESFFSGSNPYGFDFYSGYASFTGKKVLQNITAGSYRVTTGQGLIFGSAYGGRKSVEVMNIRLTGAGIRPSLSASEYSRLMGAAAHFSIKSFDVLAFYSNTNADANVADTSENGEPTLVTSLLTSGLHRTKSEITDKNALNTQLAGIHATYNGKHFTLGVTGGYNKLSSPLEPAPSMYNRFYFRGSENANFGTDFFVYLNKLTIFGEAAISSSGGIAAIAGSEIVPNSQTTLRLLYRNFARDFHTL
ncbi:MAG: helix-hairpin-helix domain-containing protein, partial [Prolixibacteraceae bacterium]|nr:helix-hairpin-helix domain-containing protein [Prolixibacteraceae bacterium]